LPISAGRRIRNNLIAASGARNVLGVDISVPAIATARELFPNVSSELPISLVHSRLTTSQSAFALSPIRVRFEPNPRLL
jgi:hypothetical protein